MKTDISESGQLQMLYKIMWESPLNLLNVETGKDEEKTFINAKGETIKEKFTPHIFYSNGEEVLKVMQSKTNLGNILLTIDGKEKNWSHKSLEHILQDVLTLQNTIKSFRKEMLEKSQKEITDQYKDPAEATVAFLAQFMPQDRLTI